MDLETLFGRVEISSIRVDIDGVKLNEINYNVNSLDTYLVNITPSGIKFELESDLIRRETAYRFNAETFFINFEVRTKVERGYLSIVNIDIWKLRSTEVMIESTYELIPTKNVELPRSLEEWKSWVGHFYSLVHDVIDNFLDDSAFLPLVLDDTIVNWVVNIGCAWVFMFPDTHNIHPTQIVDVENHCVVQK